MYTPPFTQLVRSNEGHRNGLSVVLHHKIAFGYFTYGTGKVFFPSKLLLKNNEAKTTAKSPHY